MQIQKRQFHIVASKALSKVSVILDHARRQIRVRSSQPIRIGITRDTQAILIEPLSTDFCDSYYSSFCAVGTQEKSTQEKSTQDIETIDNPTFLIDTVESISSNVFVSNVQNKWPVLPSLKSRSHTISGPSSVTFWSRASRISLRLAYFNSFAFVCGSIAGRYHDSLDGIDPQPPGFRCLMFSASFLLLSHLFALRSSLIVSKLSFSIYSFLLFFFPSFLLFFFSSFLVQLRCK